MGVELRACAEGMVQRVDPGYLTLDNVQKMHNTPIEVLGLYLNKKELDGKLIDKQ